MQQTTYYNMQNETDEDININIKKIFLGLWHQKVLMLKIILGVLLFFIILTFISAKKYIVTADLYINRANSSNMAEFNPYILDEMGSSGLSSMIGGGGNAILNEIELMTSSPVIDKVIRDNNLIYKKKWGIIPNKKEGEYISAKAFIGKGKNPSIENKKGTNVITIKYKSKNPNLAYNIVNSMILHYIEFHKEINTEKSQADIKIIESEYNRLKSELEGKMKEMNGMPASSITNTGNLSAMSAFSKSASKAISAIQNQYIRGSKSQMEISETSSKVASLSSKLEWAKMVENMSDSSKVLILKEPEQLRDFEYASPKLFTNIIMGIILGIITALIAGVIKEYNGKKLSYFSLGDNIIYNPEKDFQELHIALLTSKNDKISFIMFENVDSKITDTLKNYANINFVKAEISAEFETAINATNKIILAAKIDKTDNKLYKQIKLMLKKMNKTILSEILL